MTTLHNCLKQLGDRSVRDHVSKQVKPASEWLKAVKDEKGYKIVESSFGGKPRKVLVVAGMPAFSEVNE